MNKQPVSYLQTDPRWSNIDYSAAGEKTTIGASGCGPTSMAMILATWADSRVTPKSECDWALHHKPSYKAPHQGTYYSYFVPAAERYGLACTRVNTVSIYNNSKSPCHDTAKAAIARGDLVIACMGKGNWTKSGHYVLVWKIDETNDVIYINDPASTRAARTRGSYKLFRQQVKYYWIIQCPKDKKETITFSDADFSVKVMDRSGLNCRKGPGTENEVIKVYPFEAVVSISQISSNGWGKTDKGWINLTNTERVEDMTEKEVKTIIDNLSDEAAYNLYAKAMRHLSQKPEPDWSRKEGAWEKATQKGAFDGARPESPITRAETAAVLDRLGALD